MTEFNPTPARLVGRVIAAVLLAASSLTLGCDRDPPDSTTTAPQEDGSESETPIVAPPRCGPETCLPGQICVERGDFCSFDPLTGAAMFITPEPTCEIPPPTCPGESANLACLAQKYCLPDFPSTSTSNRYFVDQVLHCGAVHLDCIGNDWPTSGSTSSGSESTSGSTSSDSESTSGDQDTHTTESTITGAECTVDSDVGGAGDQCMLWISCPDGVSGTVNCGGSGCICQTDGVGETVCARNACRWTSPEDVPELANCCGWTID